MLLAVVVKLTCFKAFSTDSQHTLAVDRRILWKFMRSQNSCITLKRCTEIRKNLFGKSSGNKTFARWQVTQSKRSDIQLQMESQIFHQTNSRTYRSCYEIPGPSRFITFSLVIFHPQSQCSAFLCSSSCLKITPSPSDENQRHLNVQIMFYCHLLVHHIFYLT